jgi:hypothetical protein
MIQSISGQVKSGMRGAFLLSLTRIGLDLGGMMLITTNLEECDALSGQYLLDDHLTIDVTLGKSGVGRGDHLDTLRTNAKEHHEDPLSHTHI